MNTNLYNKYIELKEENKLDTKYAEIINILIFIITVIIFIALIKHTSIIDTLLGVCTFYLVAKILNFIMFGSRAKRRKRRLLIKYNLNNLKY